LEEDEINSLGGPKKGETGRVTGLGGDRDVREKETNRELCRALRKNKVREESASTRIFWEKRDSEAEGIGPFFSAVRGRGALVEDAHRVLTKERIHEKYTTLLEPLGGDMDSSETDQQQNLGMKKRLIIGSVKNCSEQKKKGA